MDLSSFRARYPEFRTAADGLVQAVLDEVATEIDATVYRDKYDVAHGMKTAQRLARSPFGKNARLSQDDGSTTWDADIRRIDSQVSARMIVT